MAAIPRWLTAAVFLCIVVASGTRAAAQAVYQDVAQELYDMQRLNYDRSRLNYDLSNGNLLGALVDEFRIGFDQQRVQGDEMRLQYDLSRQPYAFAPLAAQPAQALIPHPQYPGYYYYPSNPAQLYYYPNQSPQPIPVAAGASPAPAGPTPVQPNTLPGTSSSAGSPFAPTMIVTIRNHDSSGLTVNYTVNGALYSTTGTSVQTLDVPARAQIVFDRGGGFGVGRYTLRTGSYHFQVTDRGWELYRQQPTPTTDVSAATPNPAQNVLPTDGNAVALPPAIPGSADDAKR